MIQNAARIFGTFVFLIGQSGLFKQIEEKSFDDLRITSEFKVDLIIAAAVDQALLHI